ncbi:Benzoyl-CoA reductase/2-hydroxyglutaryl-CoA dehydratase subunit, BcrC/BadD/HgdB [Devosia enhydra]|uniref:Benzoyl-CoA reductase/2-hydroxyglutaryl-CoA dehydratase subunit, BcrC/BadD/HgdB n=1 Tax=Devosia enhydra TaxID=665118 RepID=A0A1K2HU49_9HYPH|nr:2-hydroxyacyl-CoA dehydratase family protein [Devosia enhydra]SFZ81874.1 Benzoyl-CoA reductase/2-hydroxyglutaryl-CoA dehydratase subunit, BcrC/BadD/HgdB [Devosia enhydra]
MSAGPAHRLEDIASIYADREAEARRFYAHGGRVIGVLGATVPTELITAAGMFPLRLVGDPARGTARSDAYMEPVREGYLRAIVEKLLAGDYGFLDLIVVPRSSEGLLQFYYLVEHIRTTEPELRLPALHLFDLLQTPFDYTARYVRARMEELRTRLGGIAGAPISDKAIADAIASHDAARRGFGTIVARRRTTPPAISGTTALRLAGCGQVLPVDALAALIAEAVTHHETIVPGPRLMIKGSPQEHDGFYRAVEATGATIVADDHDWGETLYETPVGDSDDPMQALVAHCMTHRPSPRRLPQEAVDAEFIARVRDAAVDGVIFALEAHDDTLGWDYPAQKRALEAIGVASILLTGQSYWSIDDRTQTDIATFVRELSR